MKILNNPELTATLTNMCLYVVLAPAELAPSDSAAVDATAAAAAAAKAPLLWAVKICCFEGLISRPSMSATNVSRSIALVADEETISTASATSSLAGKRAM